MLSRVTVREADPLCFWEQQSISSFKSKALHSVTEHPIEHLPWPSLI